MSFCFLTAKAPDEWHKWRTEAVLGPAIAAQESNRKMDNHNKRR